MTTADTLHGDGLPEVPERPQPTRERTTRSRKQVYPTVAPAEYRIQHFKVDRDDWLDGATMTSALERWVNEFGDGWKLDKIISHGNSLIAVMVFTEPEIRFSN